MPPNVLFVLTDQLRQSALGCSGNADVETPTLDHLASEGLRITNAQTTKPMCSPARGSIITGQYPHIHSVIYNQLQLPTDSPSIGQSFRQAGYRTGYIGKWHIDVNEEGPGRIPPGPRRQGFTDWEGFNDGHDHHHGHPRWDGDGNLYWEEGYQPAVQTDLAIDLLEQYAAFDAPWFLFLSWGPPHPPLEAPKEYRDRYDPDTLNLRPNVPGGNIFNRPGSARLDVEDVRADLAEYYGLITSLDAQLARLLDRLEELGETEETIVVFTSDHGEMLGSQGRYNKGAPFEEAMNVPLLVRYPGEIDAGQTSEAVVSLADIFPTLCGLCDVNIPTEVQGRNIAHHLRGGCAGPDAAYGEDWRTENDIPDSEDWGPWAQPYRVLRTREYAITIDSTLETKYLFNMNIDPYQQENLAGNQEYADIESYLRDRLFEFAARIDDREFMTRQRYMG